MKLVTIHLSIPSLNKLLTQDILGKVVREINEIIEKLNPELKKIEQDDVPRDVPKVCLKGFIQSYCECVDLSGAAICNEIDAKEKKDKTPQTEKTQIKSETGENKQQRFEIGRAGGVNPRFMNIDEPSVRSAV